MPTRKPIKKDKPIPPPQFKGIKVTGTQLRNHAIQPAHLKGIISDEGRLPDEPGIKNEKLAKAPAKALRGLGFTVKHLDVSAFRNALHAALKNDVAGYCMLLNKNGSPLQTTRWNWAKTPADGSLAWNIDVPMHVASVSKTITAMAMTKLLDNKRISYDAKIINYLPPYWIKGRNIDQITFRNLMTHTSGIIDSGMDYLSTKARVKAGVLSDKLNKYSYANMNFSLCRILIPMVDGFPMDFPYPDVYWDYFTIQLYHQYVHGNVFEPAGVTMTNASLERPTKCALAYGLPQSAGWDSGGLTSVSGGAGWHISASDLLKVMDAFRRRGSIISPAKAKSMLDSGFGIDVIQDTEAGRLYNKNGLWWNGICVEQSLAYFLPEDMEMIVLANSPIGVPAKFFRGVVSDIYLANLR